jgi:hypothetical protein
VCPQNGISSADTISVPAAQSEGQIPSAEKPCEDGDARAIGVPVQQRESLYEVPRIGAFFCKIIDDLAHLLEKAFCRNSNHFLRHLLQLGLQLLTYEIGHLLWRYAEFCAKSSRTPPQLFRRPVARSAFGALHSV